MRFTAIAAFVLAVVGTTGVSAVPSPAPASAVAAVETTNVGVTTLDVRTDAHLFEPHLIGSNYYGAPIPPWRVGYHPGWYYGDRYDVAKHFGFGFLFPCLKDVFICKLYDLIPFIFHCPGFNFPAYHPVPLPPPSQFPHGVPPPPPSPPPPSPPSHGSPPPPSGGWIQTFGGLDGAVEADDYLTFGLVDTIEAMCKDVCSSTLIMMSTERQNGSPLLTCSLFSRIHGPEAATNKGGQTQPDGSINFITDSAGFYRY
ncbi:hypothetical protein VKT23_014285 [Stygiomarasmius scandens]|uniref:Uncharacterized protein n=1 Tax=Marasmiellus scandens TaxID=2682957 RepID=A0ABR1J2C4_9AGAR